MSSWCDSASSSDTPVALSPARQWSPREARGTARRAGPLPATWGTPSFGAEGSSVSGERLPRPAVVAGALMCGLDRVRVVGILTKASFSYRCDVAKPGGGTECSRRLQHPATKMGSRGWLVWKA